MPNISISSNAHTRISEGDTLQEAVLKKLDKEKLSEKSRGKILDIANRDYGISGSFAGRILSRQLSLDNPRFKGLMAGRVVIIDLKNKVPEGRLELRTLLNALEAWAIEDANHFDEMRDDGVLSETDYDRIMNGTRQTGSSATSTTAPSTVTAVAPNEAPPAPPPYEEPPPYLTAMAASGRTPDSNPE